MSNYYVQLLRQRMYDSIELCGSGADGGHQRIFLLPARSLSSGTTSKSTLDGSFSTSHVSAATTEHVAAAAKGSKGTVLVYAPVSLDSLSEEEARELASAEAWVTTPRSLSGATQGHSHSRTRRHSYSQSQIHGRRSSSDSRRHGTGHGHGHSHSHGRISLPIHPDEGLLPSYSVGADLKS